MNIDYDINLEDIVEFNIYVLKNHPHIKNRRRIMQISFLSLISLLFIGGLVQYFAGNDSSLAVLLLVIAIGLAVFYWYSSRPSRTRNGIRKAVIRQYRKIPNEEMCRHKLSVSEEGLQVVTDYTESKAPWSAFSEIVKTPDYLYFFFQPEKAHIVPKRAFSGEKTFNRFAETAMAYFEKA